MFQMKDEMQTAVKHNIRGGDGSPSFRYLFSACLLYTSDAADE